MYLSMKITHMFTCMYTQDTMGQPIKDFFNDQIRFLFYLILFYSWYQKP